MTDVILHGGVPSAVPAFRIVVILDGDIHSSSTRNSLLAIYDRFERLFGEAANVVSYNFEGHTGRIRKATAKLIEEGRQFFLQESTKYGEGIRRYGSTVKLENEPCLPFFGLEQRSYFHFLEIAIPEDAGSAVEFADFVNRELMGTPVISGVMGMGFFLPPYNSSLKFIMGKTVARYRAAIEISPDMVSEGIRREGSAYRWKSGELPGIADIGWRTLIGAEFQNRLGELTELRDVPGVRFETSDTVLSITIGDGPVWGDVNRDEDISAYRMVARYLAPVRIPSGCLEAFGFGGGLIESHKDKVEAYLNRFD